MNNPLDKKLFLVSLFVHFFIFVLIDISYHDSNLRKTFVAYGCHSKRMTHAYFRSMKMPKKLDYEKYLKARRKKNKRNTIKTKRNRKKQNKKIAKKVPSKKNSKTKKLKKKQVPAAKKPDLKKKKSEKINNKKTTSKVNAFKADKEKLLKENEEEILHFNLMGETDPKVIMYQQCIQCEVDRLWKPPLGVPKGTECVVIFAVDQNGLVKSFNIKKRSQVLIYDLSIVRIAKEFKFDKCLWGKSFVINFRQ